METLVRSNDDIMGVSYGNVKSVLNWHSNIDRNDG